MSRADIIISGLLDPASNYVDELPKACGKCGGPVESGYGLAYGGFGPYVFCAGACEWHAKRLEDPSEE